MRRTIFVLVLLAVAATPGAAANLILDNAPSQICFSPGGNCTDVIVGALAGARREVLVQAYSFTSAPIAKALLDAHKREVKVQVILDKSQRSERYSSADFLANSGIPVSIDSAHAIAHNKVMVIDGEMAVTGSFNFH